MARTCQHLAIRMKAKKQEWAGKKADEEFLFLIIPVARAEIATYKRRMLQLVAFWQSAIGALLIVRQ